ncbi:hypothetical protein [uncultured Georgenia sp.]|uniref:hypothetical protein n=1 Tax=uncultured Georgenia sp. TaxID=378209 RepID=UPI00262BBAA6|nr:hypothetical protein [uncultured Georgenia sp.]HLV05360.1 hypothetical protein [Actinomycetaceae bacterium]
MGLPIKLRHVPPRLAAGVYILNSGLNKRGVDDEAAAGMQAMAAHALPQLKEMSARDFAKLLSTGETALGAALLLPFVPSWLAGLGLTAFSAGLVRMYLNTPGMTEDDGFRPTAEGTGLAKDVFLLGIGLGLVLDALTSKQK